jgi:nucleoside 2-deoxyribosyltransferase
MKIYIASFFDTRERLRPFRDELWKLGHEVVSTWLDEVARPKEMSKQEFNRKLAIKDLAEIKSADLLILDTFDITPRGGREVEFGFALGQFQSKLLWIVGPNRNVFHELADDFFPSWDNVIGKLKAIYDSK